MFRRLKKFLALEARYKLLLVQAWFMLGWYRAAILLLPFKRLVSALEHQANTVQSQEMAPARLQEARRIGYVVSAAASITPWQSLCLVQVLVVQRLLVRRGIPGEFFLGVSKGEQSEQAPDGMAAHAWLRCGDEIVSGEAGHEQFTVLSTFSWGGVGG